MLETVKQKINEPCISFVEYFSHYVMDVQDRCIEYEFSTLKRNNAVTLSMLDRLIWEQFKGGQYDK